MVHFTLPTVLLAAALGLAAACAPGQYGGQYAGTAGLQESYIRQYQQLHRDNPCVQCQAIVAESDCSNNWHDAQFGCATPRVHYGLGPRGCGQATITCPAQGGRQSTLLVALVDNADGRFGPDSRVYAPISALQGAQATLTQTCDSQSQWTRASLDDLRLAQPLTVQCAHNAPDFQMPPVHERYAAFERHEPSGHADAQAYEQEHTAAPTAPVVAEEAERVLDEDVRVEILGTTLVPVVKERVVEQIVKETHNIPIQRKRIVKTKHLSKPVVAEREVVERVPATRIVPTFEERRRVEQIRGTTIESFADVQEVTEMLPEVITSAPVIVEGPPETRGKLLPVQPAAYETPAETPAAYETPATPAAAEYGR